MPEQPPGPPGSGFLQNGGEMGVLMRAYDWTKTPLGPPALWPQALKTTLRLLLTSRHPMFIWWGPDLIQFYNDAYRQTMGPERHPRALGQRGGDCWQEIWDTIGPQIEYVMAGKGATWNEHQLVPVTRYGRREDVWWTYGYSPIENEYGVAGVLVVCTDVTKEAKSRSDLKADRDRLREMFEQAPGFMTLLTGSDHVFEICNRSYLQLFGHGREIVGKPVREALPEVEGQGFFELLDRVFLTGEPFAGRDLPIIMQADPSSAGEQRYVDFIYQPIRDATGAVTGIFVEGYDVTQRHDAEQQQKLLVQELNHRVKNLFAVAGGMITLTARTAQTPQDMAKTVRGRLEALARASDLIHVGHVGSSDQVVENGTTLDVLVRAVLLPYFEEPGSDCYGRVNISGPAVPIGGTAVTSLALVLHETATNAAKYGALSAPAGCVRVEWKITGTELLIRWTELGGPLISAPPTRSGFGSDLVKRSVQGQLHGSIDHEWRPDGLTTEIAIPVEHLRG